MNDNMKSIKKGRLVMLSPHHADMDYRVRRSIEVIVEIFGTVDIFWDENYTGHQRKKHKFDSHVNEYYIKNKSKEFLKLLFGQAIFCPEVVLCLNSASHVYIHASGLEGLLYCREVKRINPSCLVIFDYHDSLTYELFYQLKKSGLEKLFKPVWGLYKFYIKSLMESVDALMGISTTQVNDFQRLLGRELVGASVPNFRDFSNCFSQVKSVTKNDEISLVWLGSVMKGRDLSWLANWVSQLDRMPHLHVFGNVINQSMVSDLQELLGDQVSFYGEFKDESEILPHLPHKTIGVFLGWDDPQDTNINSHASPNKYFTYINMELPVVINSSLSELSASVEDTQAGLSVANQQDFSQAIEKISQDYSSYVVGSRRLKALYGKVSIKQTILDFFHEVSKV